MLDSSCNMFRNVRLSIGPRRSSAASLKQHSTGWPLCTDEKRSDSSQMADPSSPSNYQNIEEFPVEGHYVMVIHYTLDLLTGQNNRPRDGDSALHMQRKVSSRDYASRLWN